jgi:hypothetical protein
MPVQSRSTLPYECHQVLHPWHENCIPAAFMLATPAFTESLKIYCVLYGVRIDLLNILQRKYFFTYSGYRTYKITKNKNIKRITTVSSWISY